MKNNFVIFFIVFALFGTHSPLKAEKGKKKRSEAISKKEKVETSESVWGVETLQRSDFIYPSNSGLAGIFRVHSAEGLPNKTLTFGIGAEFYAVTNAPNFGSGAAADTVAENIFVGFSPLKHLTLGIMRRNSSTTFGTPRQLISSLGDFTFMGQYRIPLNKWMVLAPILDVTIASNFNSLTPSGETVSYGLGAAFTTSLFRSSGLPIFLHANALYHSPQYTGSGTGSLNAETFFDFSRHHSLTLGLGAEIKLGDFIPFVEMTQKTQFNSGLDFGNSPSKISFGTRFHPLKNKSLSLLLGMDLGLGKGLVYGVPFTPDYQIIGQISYTVALSNTERRHYYTTKDVNVVDRKFIIKKAIKFKVDSAEIVSGTDLLDQIVTVIKENRVNKLLIVGHTDSSATEDYNLRLSKARANNVRKYLIKAGVPARSLVAQGLGKRRPRASNLTPEGRAENRRVEFFILE